MAPPALEVLAIVLIADVLLLDELPDVLLLLHVHDARIAVRCASGMGLRVLHGGALARMQIQASNRIWTEDKSR
jgi:hypothetical protein